MVAYPARLKTAAMVFCTRPGGHFSAPGLIGRCQTVRPLMIMCREGVQTAPLKEPMWWAESKIMPLDAKRSIVGESRVDWGL